MALDDEGENATPAAAVEPLSEADYQRIPALLEFITDRPYQYESHVEYIGLLHRGFLAHQQAGSEGPYPFLEDLRKGRQEMLERFPLKESMWLEWIADESSIARSAEEVMVVMELCARAVEEENASVALWRTYAQFLEVQYSETRKKRRTGFANQAEEVIRDLFTMELVMETYKLGAQATMHVISGSNLIWDRYRDLLMKDLEADPSSAKLEYIRSLYQARLQVPHATISDTFSAFSSFTTRYNNANYESIMVSTNKIYAAALEKYSQREMFELRLKRERDNIAEEWNIWEEYLKWETSQPNKKLDHEMACTLYERCLLRFGDQARVWEAYVFFVLEKVNTSSRTISVLTRATRHCPWSGTLWAQYIIALEKGAQPFDVVSDVKHRATKTGMLDLGGLEEVLKVNIAWCGFLKRRAFEQDASEDDFDMAEMGISEAVTETGKEDPEYRLQRIHINFCTLANKLQGARSIWTELAGPQANSYEFWLRYYQWELTHGEKETAGDVLKQALRVKTIDWPEKILETYRNHVEDYGNVQDVEWATIRYRKLSMDIQERRAREAQEAAAYQQVQYQEQQQQQEQEADAAQPEEEARGTLKRRRSILEADDAQQSKKPKPEVFIKDMPLAPALPSAASVAKRDRENTTVIVKNLPAGYPEVKVRQFFRECGTINSINIITEKDGRSATATVEFDTKEDVLAAQTKDGKSVEGRAIEVQIGTGSTLYVTNFPPSADEAYIRDLFKGIGEIVDVRFPSLKYNTHRRFCYVQFVSSEQAQKATELNGKQLGEKETLVAKISAPNQKVSRSGAVHEGRELFIRNIDFKANEKDLEELFTRYGKVEKVRMPQGPRKGSHKGFGFVSYGTREQADEAVALNGFLLKGRPLDVTIASANPGKHRPGNAVESSTRGSTPCSEANGDHNMDTPSPAAAAAAASGPGSPPPSFDDIKKKTLGIMNVADTVNDFKIRELFEKFGPLRKVTLRPDHQGAIVEYNSVADAGKATLALDGSELAGRRISIGSLPDLMKQKPEVKKTKGFAPAAKKEADGNSGSGKPAFFAAPTSVIRGVPPARGQKRRGGLGFSGSIARPKAPDGKSEGGGGDTEMGDGGDPGKPAKSNADFKAMFLRK
ncbi:hypothetical protein P167DRAFT_486416 [Morchella conica CCBAS932]|uniref:U4/U6 snRNA-associated-splicing factor PRP24 n=1 Tax=Morchella conica CCBAS932 TaxID=1392247 RepID=A0A3N4KS58_9PEZI|nr:hypothetical protein P167DRAFT_486416 [Morchella conica CCBAS932]